MSRRFVNKGGRRLPSYAQIGASFRSVEVRCPECLFVDVHRIDAEYADTSAIPIVECGPCGAVLAAYLSPRWAAYSGRWMAYHASRAARLDDLKIPVRGGPPPASRPLHQDKPPAIRGRIVQHALYVERFASLRLQYEDGSSSDFGVWLQSKRSAQLDPDDMAVTLGSLVIIWPEDDRTARAIVETLRLSEEMLESDAGSMIEVDDVPQGLERGAWWPRPKGRASLNEPAEAAPPPLAPTLVDPPDEEELLEAESARASAEASGVAGLVLRQMVDLNREEPIAVVEDEEDLSFLDELPPLPPGAVEAALWEGEE